MVRQISNLSVGGEDFDDDAAPNREAMEFHKYPATRNLQHTPSTKDVSSEEDDTEGSEQSLQHAQTQTDSHSSAFAAALARRQKIAQQKQAATRNLFASIPEDQSASDLAFSYQDRPSLEQHIDPSMKLDSLVSPRNRKTKLRGVGVADAIPEDISSDSIPTLSDISSRDLSREFSMASVSSDSSYSTSCSSLSSAFINTQAKIAAVHFNVPLHENATGQRLSGLAPKISHPTHLQNPHDKWGSSPEDSEHKTVAVKSDDAPTPGADNRLSVPVRELSDRDALLSVPVRELSDRNAVSGSDSNDSAPNIPKRELSDRSQFSDATSSTLTLDVTGTSSAPPMIPRRQVSNQPV